MKETGIRILSGTIYLALIIALAFASGFWSVTAFLIISMLAAREFGELFWKQSKGRVELLVYAIAALVIGAGAPLLMEGVTIWDGLLFTIGALLICIVIILRASTNIRSALAGMILGMVWIGIPFALLPHLASMGSRVFLSVFILVWLNDTFAYVFGKLLGRKKLSPIISPGKTWEGFFGGALLTMVGGFALGVYWPIVEIWQWIVIAACVVVVATTGDLMESALKRYRGVKDSGKIMPGHGGVLDRFDGLLLAIPMYWLLLHVFEVIN